MTQKDEGWVISRWAYQGQDGVGSAKKQVWVSQGEGLGEEGRVMFFTPDRGKQPVVGGIYEVLTRDEGGIRAILRLGSESGPRLVGAVDNALKARWKAHHKATVTRTKMMKVAKENPLDVHLDALADAMVGMSWQQREAFLGHVIRRLMRG